MNLLPADQRGIKVVKNFIPRCKRREINPTTSTLVPFSFRRRGAGDEVHRIKYSNAMKRFDILFCFLLLTSLAAGQNQYPFLAPHRIWSVLEETSCSSGTSSYKCPGDTIINGNSYRKVVSCYCDSSLTNWYPESYYVRETATGEVFKYESGSEHRIYTFNLVAGDSVFTGYQIGGIDAYAQVDIVDSILINNSFRKRIIFDPWFNEVWIEGIGSLSMPFSPFINSFFSGLQFSLLCVCDSANVTYQKPGWNTCYYVFTGMDNARESLSMVTVYPNPLTSATRITINHPEQASSRIDLYNQEMKMVFSDQFSGHEYTLGKTTLSPGIYFLVITVNERPFYKKVVIKE